MKFNITKPFENNTTNRWVDGLSNEQYQSLNLITSSKIKCLYDCNSPFHFYSQYVLRNVPYKTTSSMKIGTIAHLAIFEREKFETNVIEHDFDCRTSEYKEFVREIYNKNKPELNKFEDLPTENQQEIQAALAWSCIKKKELEENKNEENEEKFKSAMEAVRKIHERFNLRFINEEKSDTSEKEVKKRGRKKSTDENESENNDVEKIEFTKDGAIKCKNGKEIFLVKKEEMQKYRQYQKNLDSHKRLSVLINNCIFEQSGVAQDPVTGLFLGIRGDARGPSYFIDGKTLASTPTTKSMENYAADYGLHMQAVHYLETANLIEPDKYRKFFFMFMSKEAPYEIALAQLDSDCLQYASKRRREILNFIAECENKNVWLKCDERILEREGVNYIDAGVIINLPQWGYK